MSEPTALAIIDQRTASDCMRCCVAMVLGLAYEDVPDFVAEHDGLWSAELAVWARERGFDMIRAQGKRNKRTPRMTAMAPGSEVMWIADGPGPRGHDHAVVLRGEEMFHDPHPSRAGINHMHGMTILVPRARALEPAEAPPRPPKLEPDLLRACAAYLAHQDAFAHLSHGLPYPDEMALLRGDSRLAAKRRTDSVTPPSDDDCDRLTMAHLDSICRVRDDDMGPIARSTSLAIRAATPSMLLWWCRRLER